jgi:hypothetical protein
MHIYINYRWLKKVSYSSTSSFCTAIICLLV